jgi:hypothetical protein
MRAALSRREHFGKITRAIRITHAIPEIDSLAPGAIANAAPYEVI